MGTKLRRTKTKKQKSVDPEMLRNLDLLMDMALLENEQEWELLDKIDLHSQEEQTQGADDE